MQEGEDLSLSEYQAIEKIRLLDLDTLAKKRGHDKEDIEMMLGIFLNKVDTQLEMIAQAVKEKDYETLFVTAHTIRGSLLNIGFDEIAGVAKVLELGAKGSHDIKYEKKFLQLNLMIDIIKGSTYE